MKIRPAQKKSLTTTAKQFDVDFLVAFGSQVSGRTHPGSDLDIGYYRAGGKDLTFNQRYRFEQTLQKIFDDFKIDLVSLAQAPILLKQRAAFQGQLLDEIQPHSFTRFQMRAYIDYIDTKPLRISRDRHLAKKYA